MLACMVRAVDPRVRRFLERHGASIEDEVEADVTDARACTPAERWAQLERLTSVLSWLRASGQTDLARVLELREPPHPSYAGIVARLRAERRAR